MSVRFLALIGLLATAAWSTAGAMLPGLVHPTMQAELSKAERALDSGDSGLAEAISSGLRPGVITVAIDFSRMPFERRSECLRAANLAMNMWEDALSGAVAFEVSPESMAQIRLKFQPEVYVAGARAAGKAVITRATVNWGWGSYGRHLSGTLEVSAQSMESMASTAAHELGHVLGLADSGSRDGVMGAMLDPGVLKTPSMAEISALQSLYFEAEQLQLRAQTLRPH